jgi:hypothetical protein
MRQIAQPNARIAQNLDKRIYKSGRAINASGHYVCAVMSLPLICKSNPLGSLT